MAMGRQSIEYCKQDVSYFNGSWENSDYKTKFNLLQDDAEYKKFIAETDLGEKLNVKLNSMFDLYGDLWKTLGELGDKTRSFLSVQEALNAGDTGESGGDYMPGYTDGGYGNYSGVTGSGYYSTTPPESSGTVIRPPIGTGTGITTNYDVGGGN